MTLPLITPHPTEVRALELPGGRSLALDQDVPLVMGVMNLTPDSFSDGGLWNEPERAVERALEMLEQGAHIIDLGAESTRPGGGVYGGGADEILAPAEIDRLLPVLDALRPETGAPISIDTRKAAVADAVLTAGADLINDVSALAEPALAAVLADAACPVVLMHSRGSLSTMQQDIHFDNVTSEVLAELTVAIDRAVDAGIPRSQIVVDPGIGFGKTTEQNLQLLRRLNAFNPLGPVLVGASRKSFIGDVTGARVDARLPGSLAAVAWAATNKAAIVRVHDVSETVQFLDVWQSIGDAQGAAR